MWCGVKEGLFIWFGCSRGKARKSHLGGYSTP
jgi:hypothetical protein